MNWYKVADKISKSIQLTPEEHAIFNVIKAGRDAYASGVQLRIAGGWVRDRLLGKVSDDIDIAVSGGDGNSVAEAVRRYDIEQNAGKHTKDPYAVSLEKTQPGEKKTSAGLKVGAIDINGIKVEFVPMRTEIYNPTSRVPEISATNDPTEDVKRRDLTINAIYYNIDTGKIEDYVGGVKDLENGILRTPVDPVVTLKEDPLRALRALRFLSQMYGFELDEQLVEALKHPEVHKSYLDKVAPERARKELEKLVLGKRPADAIRHFFSSGLYLPVFHHKKLYGFKPIHMDQNNPHHQYNLLEHTVHVVKNLNNMLIDAGVSDKERMIAVMAAIFHDFGKMDPNIVRPSKSNPNASSYPGHENVSAELAVEILKRLGFGNERELISKVVQEHMRPHGEMQSPKSIGKFLRDFESMSIGDDSKTRLWWLTFMHAIADSMSKGGVDYDEEVKGKHDQIKTIEKFIEERSKVGTKPLLNGKEIMDLFPDKNPKTGFINVMQNALAEAQDSGEIKDKNEAKKFLLLKFNN